MKRSLIVITILLAACASNDKTDPNAAPVENVPDIPTVTDEIADETQSSHLAEAHTSGDNPDSLVANATV